VSYLTKRSALGARFNNPAAALSRIKVRQKQLELPSRDEFLRFVEAIRTAGARQSKDCANLVRFLAYSGVRIGEAKFVTWSDVNFDRRQLHVKGDPETATKNGETRYVPMIPELEKMLRKLRAERPDEPSRALCDAKTRDTFRQHTEHALRLRPLAKAARHF
jgi:integrase